MRNYVENGDTVVVTAPEDADSGEFLVVGALHGVAVAAAVSGAQVVLKRSGVFELLKDTAVAWVQGDRLYWDASAKKFTKTAGANQAIGVAFAAALDTDTTGLVFLNPAGGGAKIASGQITTATASDTVVTGLAKVIAAWAGLDDNPGDDPMLANASIGDQNGAPAAGSILVKTWKNTGGTDPTPLAATTFSKKVNWFAIGI